MTTYETTRQADGSVRYWDVYQQQWAVVYTQAQVSGQVLASLPDDARAMIAALPKHGD